MSRVLLLGVGPLPSPAELRVHATGLRLHWFQEALRAAGHEVIIGEIAFGGSSSTFRPIHGKGIQAHRRLDYEKDKAVTTLNSWVRDFEPDAVVALTDLCANYISSSVYTGPLHVDFFGDPMAERQQQAFAHGSNASLADAWLMILPALLRADRFSVCSNAQRLAFTGQLAAAGRMNAETTLFSPLIDVIPMRLPVDRDIPKPPLDMLLEYGITGQEKIIFASGGYNTWLDEETLFLGLEEALRLDPELIFVSTGGGIDGHVNKVFESFKARIDSSPLKERFRLLGWIPHEHVHALMSIATVGVSTDTPSLEGELGCRNRLLEWRWFGMNIVAPITCEATQQLVTQGHVISIPARNATALTTALIEASKNFQRPDLTSLRLILREQWGSSEPFDPLNAWLAAPWPASDRQDGVVNNPLAELQRDLLATLQRRSDDKSIRQQARETAQMLLGSRLISLYGKLHPVAVERLRKLSEL